MADKYTVADSPALEAPTVDDKDKMVTRSWSQKHEESFTVRNLENQIAHCDAEIERCEARKAELQAKVDSAISAMSE